MTEQTMIQIYNDMVEHYGSKLPDPEHQPIEFKYYLTLFLYYRKGQYDNS